VRWVCRPVSASPASGQATQAWHSTNAATRQQQGAPTGAQIKCRRDGTPYLAQPLPSMRLLSSNEKFFASILPPLGAPLSSVAKRPAWGSCRRPHARWQGVSVEPFPLLCGCLVKTPRAIPPPPAESGTVSPPPSVVCGAPPAATRAVAAAAAAAHGWRCFWAV
jgi:hypothetical protein